METVEKQVYDRVIKILTKVLEEKADAEGDHLKRCNKGWAEYALSEPINAGIMRF